MLCIEESDETKNEPTWMCEFVICVKVKPTRIAAKNYRLYTPPLVPLHSLPLCPLRPDLIRTSYLSSFAGQFDCPLPHLHFF